MRMSGRMHFLRPQRQRARLLRARRNGLLRSAGQSAAPQRGSQFRSEYPSRKCVADRPAGVVGRWQCRGQSPQIDVGAEQLEHRQEHGRRVHCISEVAVHPWRGHAVFHRPPIEDIALQCRVHARTDQSQRWQPVPRQNDVDAGALVFIQWELPPFASAGQTTSKLISHFQTFIQFSTISTISNDCRCPCRPWPIKTSGRSGVNEARRTLTKFTDHRRGIDRKRAAASRIRSCSSRPPKRPTHHRMSWCRSHPAFRALSTRSIRRWSPPSVRMPFQRWSTPLPAAPVRCWAAPHPTFRSIPSNRRRMISRWWTSTCNRHDP